MAGKPKTLAEAMDREMERRGEHRHTAISVSLHWPPNKFGVIYRGQEPRGRYRVELARWLGVSVAEVGALYYRQWYETEWAAQHRQTEPNAERGPR